MVGRIGRAHGLRGEVAVTFSSNRPERTAPGAVLYAGDRELVVDAARPHQGRMLVRFAGVDDRTAAERLLGAELTADPLAGAADVLDDDELWVHELVGAEVVDRAGAPLGRVDRGRGEPGARPARARRRRARPAWCSWSSSATACVVVDPPDGLLDL